MKRSIHILLLAIAVFTVSGVSAQMKTAYFMEGSIQRLDMNAAFVPQRGYVNIPGLGNLGLGYTSNAFSVRNFLYPNPDGEGLVTFMHNSVDAGDFLKRLRNKNHMEFGLRENILGFGGFTKRYFWSFNINLRSESSITVPKEFFRLAKDLQEGTYNLKDFQIDTDNYLEFAIGFAFPIRIATQDFNIGFRAKALAGAAHARLNMESMNVEISDDVWRADMRGQLSGNVAGIDFSNLTGVQTIDKITDEIDFGNFSPSRIGSWGLAFDIGADTRLLNDRLKLSLGLNDIGFIAWSNKSAINGAFENLSVAFNGYDFDKEEVDFDKPDDVTINVGTPRTSIRMLTATLNIGGEYNILDDKIGFGLLSQTRFYGNYTSAELTLSANFRPSQWFSASVSHSMLHNRIGVFGLALNVHPSWINLFIGMDYIGLNYAKYNSFEFIPKNMNSLNFYFGLAVPITKPKRGGSFPITLRRDRDRD